MDDITKNEMSEQINNCLKMFTPRENRILDLRFYETKTLEEIGDDVFLSRERVRGIINKCLMRLRHPCKLGNHIKEMREYGK